MATTTKCKTEHGDEFEEEIVNVFSLEIDTLECDVCSLPFESKVYSCKNGHAVCFNCCISIDPKCKSCRQPTDDFRCLAMEKILAGMTRPCRFKKHGCPETVRYTKARAHEEACPFAPYRCPFDGCAYRGALLYGHVQDAHEPRGGGTTFLDRHGWWSVEVTLQKAPPFLALLHPEAKSVYLLLNSRDVLTGRSLSLVRVSPYAAELYEEDYEMTVKAAAGPWSLSARGIVQFVRQFQGYKAKRFLFVPDEFWGSSSGSVTVSVNLL